MKIKFTNEHDQEVILGLDVGPSALSDVIVSYEVDGCLTETVYTKKEARLLKALLMYELPIEKTYTVTLLEPPAAQTKKVEV